MKFGSYCEDFILDSFTETSGFELSARQLGRTIPIRLDNVKVPFHSTFDGMTKDLIPVEAKSHFGYWDIEKLSDIYGPQLQHHCIVGMKTFVWFPVLFGLNCRFQFRKIKRDYEWGEGYMENAKNFWLWYKEGIEPKGAELLIPPDTSEMFTMEMTELEQWDANLKKNVESNVQCILSAKESQEEADKAKIELRHIIPRKCRSMTYKLENNLKGLRLEMTRIKDREPSIKIIKIKESV